MPNAYGNAEQLPAVTVQGAPPPSGGGGFSPWGAVGSVLSSLIGNAGARKRQERADKINLANWNRQNQYNHPLQQMERLKAAGLNPNLIYGNSPGSAVGNAGSAVHSSKAAPYSMANPIIPGFQAGQLQAQTANLSTQSVKNLADARKSLADTGISKQRLLEMESVFGDYLTKAAGDAEQAKYAGKSAKIGFEIKNATKQDQIDKIVAEANLAGLKQEVEQEIRDRAVDGGWIKGDTIGNLLNSYLGIDKDTPQWKKNYVVTAPGVAAIVRTLPPQAQAAFLVYYGGSALLKAFNEYMEGK